MNASTIANKLVSISRIFLFLGLISLPLSVQAEYYLVYGSPVVAVCDSCARHYYRPVHKVHKVKTYKHRCGHKKYYRTVRKRSHYSITVYYPVPVYPAAPVCCDGCGSCGGFLEPTYYWAPAPYGVYYTHPDDRLVANRYQDNYYDPSVDTGTADNDIQ